MHGEKGSEGTNRHSVGPTRLGSPHTVGGIYKASIEKVGPGDRVPWMILSSLILISGRACALSL